MSEVALSATIVAGLLDAAPDGLLMVDPDGRLTMVNSRIEELFGYPRSELLGRTVEMLVPESASQRHVTHRSEFAEGPRIRAMGDGQVLRGRRRDGSEFPVEISLSPLTTSDGGWVIAAVRDGTKRQLAERSRGDALLGADRERIGRQLADTVIRSLFGAGLRLQGMCEQADERMRAGLDEVISDIDRTIREIRDLVFESADGRTEGSSGEGYGHDC